MLYGSATTRQILKLKRSRRAHIYSYMALYELATEQFLDENPDLKEKCQDASFKMEDACSAENKNTKFATVLQAHEILIHTLTQENLLKRLQDWEAQK